MRALELKNSILQLAFQGQLVENHSEDDSVNELYNIMQLEKSDLVKTKRIKKEKQLPDITDEELPFSIPNNWKWVRVGDIGSWGAGATPARSNPKYYGGKIPWLKTGDLTDGSVSYATEHITELALEKTSVKLNPAGSVLMAMYGATIGKLGILEIEATTNQACCACSVYNGMLNKYLFFYLMSQRTNYIKLGVGGAQPNISKEKIIASLIPLPPLEEQKRIVAKIEELMPYVEKYSEVYNKLEELNANFPYEMNKSILQYAMQGKIVRQNYEEGNAKDLVEEARKVKQKLISEKQVKKQKTLANIDTSEVPFEIPSSWEWIRFGDLVNFKIGATPPRSDASAWTGNFPWVSIADMISNSLIETTKDKISKTALDSKFKGNMTPKGTMIMSFKLTVGKVSILDIDATHNEGIISIYPYVDVENITRDYLFKILPVMSNYGDTKGAIKGKTLNSTSLNNLLIPLPPIKEQQRIVRKIDELTNYSQKLAK